MAGAGRCLIVLWLVTGALALWAQGVIVCGKCGREAKPGDVVCRHCQDALPKPKIDAPPPAVEPTVPVNVEAEAGRMAAILVEANVRQARDLEAKQPELSLCYYQNAMALMRLVTAGKFPAAAGAAILDGNTRLLTLLQRGAVPCRRCGGSGRYQLDLGKVDRSKGLKAVDGVPCTACKGAGAVPRIQGSVESQDADPAGADRVRAAADGHRRCQGRACLGAARTGETAHHSAARAAHDRPAVALP